MISCEKTPAFDTDTGLNLYILVIQLELKLTNYVS